tara:strand:- start:1682 stop:1891 length:210 start_codon:yes stop_codon:yes gene_type:complete
MSSDKESIQSTVEDVTNSDNTSVEFTSNDVKVVMNIIDVASARGCFRPPEMKGIGEFYEKLSGLLPQEK